jgi:hypothetical protein
MGYHQGKQEIIITKNWDITEQQQFFQQNIGYNSNQAEWEYHGIW